mmetsp:Transcript_50981/g.143504  ORF Transcript_50981/g.143504 Transcript_50981/m.143504 type:complete len:369 (-) Transcript_50981:284-1390(-)
MGNEKRHWASRVKLGYAEEFASKGIPLERLDAEEKEEELRDLERFFDVTRESVIHPIAVTFAAMAFSSAATPGEQTDGKARKQTASDGESNARWKWRALKWKAMNSDMVVDLAKDRAVSGDSSSSAPPVSTHSSSSSASATPTARSHSRPSVPTKEKMERLAGGSVSPGRMSVTPRSDKTLSRVSVTPRSDRTLSVLVPEGDAKDIETTFLDEEETPRKSTARMSLRRRIHRPVASWELEEAKTPAPISVGDFPPVVPRTPGRDRPKESHYDYFARKTPMEAPVARKSLQKKTETMRKSYTLPSPCHGATTPLPPSGSDAVDPKAASARRDGKMSGTADTGRKVQSGHGASHVFSFTGISLASQHPSG